MGAAYLREKRASRLMFVVATLIMGLDRKDHPIKSGQVKHGQEDGQTRLGTKNLINFNGPKFRLYERTADKSGRRKRRQPP